MHCLTSGWQPGDYFVDTFEVTAGSFAYPKTRYRVWAGLFRGSPGNWINMKARGDGVVADRVPIGNIELR